MAAAAGQTFQRDVGTKITEHVAGRRRF